MSTQYEDMKLPLTRSAANLWFEFPYPEIQRLVEVLAVREWGEGTTCLFPDIDIILIEHLDGRAETLRPTGLMPSRRVN